jgi:hypothetical protein
MLSVKPPHCLVHRLNRVLDRLLHAVLGDWWIDLILMIFIVGTMLYEHFN